VNLVRARNIWDLLVVDSVRNWARSRRTVMPALGSMAALLLLAGLGAVAALAARNVLDQEASGAAVLHVYLREGAPSARISALHQRLASDGRVRAVRYVSKQDALRAVKDRPGLGSLVQQAGTNPLPASFEVSVRNLQDVGAVADAAARDPATDPDLSTSYDTNTYRTLQSFLRIAGGVTAAFLLALALVAATVTGNAVRAAILARWDEVTTMWLVGASAWMLRGPFMVEGTLTGAVAGAVAAALLLGVYAAAQGASGAMFAQVLPGVDWVAALACAVAVVGAGLVLGGLAALAGMRTLAGVGRQ
jgi:cell division transport system permease protein